MFIGQIADFGMSRDLVYESFYTSCGGMIPVKWTAPEVVRNLCADTYIVIDARAMLVTHSLHKEKFRNKS